MISSPTGFLRTALPQSPLSDRDSSLDLPSSQRQPRDRDRGRDLDRSLRLRRQVHLSLVRRRSSSGSLLQARTYSEPAGYQTAPLFDSFTVPLLDSGYGYSKHRSQVDGADSGQSHQDARYSSETGRFLSQGLQCQATKPTRRIEVAVDDSPVLVRAQGHKESRYRGGRSPGRIRARSYGQRSSSVDVGPTGWWSVSRPSLWRHPTYQASAVGGSTRQIHYSRSWSHLAQRQSEQAVQAARSVRGTFVHRVSTDLVGQLPLAGHHPEPVPWAASAYRRVQSSPLEEQLHAVSASVRSSSQRLDRVVKYNWNQTSVQTSADIDAVTEEFIPAETADLQDQAQTQSLGDLSSTPETQEAQVPSMTASCSTSVDGEWTMDTAVAALAHDKMEYVVYGANFIQHECFQRPEAKKELYELDGIERLMQLLSNEEVEVQRAVCGAIRNGVFEENDSKLEVRDQGGLQKLVQLLGHTKDIETRRQITGLMWNLSSNEQLKSELIEEALHPLNSSIIIPYSGWPDGDVKPMDVDPDIFYNTTGCLRNLSSASPEGRKQMRECEGLIDSLVLYIQFTIANNQEDDKSTENCTCVLHNLAFQLENELPSAYTERLGWRKHLGQQKSPGCFGGRSPKPKEEGVTENVWAEEMNPPQGVAWLWHRLVVRMYLSLIARSTRTCTQEASLGALQNLTASTGPMGTAITESISRGERGLQHLRRTLHSPNSRVCNATLCLLRNMSRHPGVQAELAGTLVPDLATVLPVAVNSVTPDDTTALICQVMHALLQGRPQLTRTMAQGPALPSLVELSRREQNAPSSASKAASNLLYNLWLFRDLHSVYKKAGFTKSDFINTRTTKVYHSLRDRKTSL
ncbi:plakophilin-2 [Amblyraja radiata]|uniref:plakophilin-2 n=1 Tax=Amblyraja radiata TaxID=386614 RepID=UPI0014037C37|nr:plakophilin-2 [Amblyraja radiata]